MLPERVDEVGPGEIWERVVCTRRFVAEVLVSACICAGIHVLVTWGSLSDWNAHALVDACLYRWDHPRGFGELMAQDIPLDAFFTALFVCLGQAVRQSDVRRGSLPHVRRDAFHRGVVAVL